MPDRKTWTNLRRPSGGRADTCRSYPLVGVYSTGMADRDSSACLRREDYEALVPGGSLYAVPPR